MNSSNWQLSLSSCWNSQRHCDGYEMVDEIRNLGFEKVELSHGIRVSLVPGVLKAVAEGIVEISSVHNFCPLPGAAQHAAPNLFEPTSKARTERDSWQYYSRQTIEFASRVGAAQAVLHSGSVRFYWNSPHQAFAISDNDKEVPEKIKKRALRRLRKKAAAALPRLIEAYDALAPFSSAHNVLLCVENRGGLLELPLDADILPLFGSLEHKEAFAYWHDTGHAQIKQLMGLVDHQGHLEKLASHLVGWHLHDVSSSGQDHQVPGSGTVDFKMLRRFIRPNHTLVMELDPQLSSGEVRRSRQFLLETLG